MCRLFLLLESVLVLFDSFRVYTIEGSSSFLNSIWRHQAIQPWPSKLFLADVIRLWAKVAQLTVPCQPYPFQHVCGAGFGNAGTWQPDATAKDDMIAELSHGTCNRTRRIIMMVICLNLVGELLWLVMNLALRDDARLLVIFSCWLIRSQETSHPDPFTGLVAAGAVIYHNVIYMSF